MPLLAVQGFGMKTTYLGKIFELIHVPLSGDAALNPVTRGADSIKETSTIDPDPKKIEASAIAIALYCNVTSNF